MEKIISIKFRKNIWNTEFNYKPNLISKGRASSVKKSLNSRQQLLRSKTAVAKK